VGFNTLSSRLPSPSPPSLPHENTCPPHPRSLFRPCPQRLPDQKINCARRPHPACSRGRLCSLSLRNWPNAFRFSPSLPGMKTFFAIFALLCLAVQPAMPAQSAEGACAPAVALPSAGDDHCACCPPTDCACSSSPGDTPARSAPFLPQRSGPSHDCPGVPVATDDSPHAKFKFVGEQRMSAGHDAGPWPFAAVPLFIRHCSPLW
jgi:hypothetical protein